MEEKISDEPAWVAEKATLDALDDGEGPYLDWFWEEEPVIAQRRGYWADFLTWAAENMGQGFSMACSEGNLLDVVTSHCFQGYIAGREAEMSRAHLWMAAALGLPEQPTDEEIKRAAEAIEAYQRRQDA